MGIQLCGDLRPTFFLSHEGIEDAPDDLYFGLRPRHQNDAIGFKALLLPVFELSLWSTVFIDQLAAHSVTGRAALPKAQGSPTAMTDGHFRGKLAAILARHHTLHIFQDGGDKAAIVFELLGTVRDPDTRVLADEFVIGALIGVLEATPAADI